MVTHVLKGVEGCKSVGNRTNGKDLVKVAYKRVLSIRHDVNAWCAARHEPETVACHSKFKDQQQQQRQPRVYFGNRKLMVLLNRL